MKFRTLICAGALSLMCLPNIAMADGYADDRAEIDDLMSAYMWAFDTLNARDFPSFFTADGELVLTGEHFPPVDFKGTEKLGQFIGMIRARNHLPADWAGLTFSPNIHQFSNLVLTIDGNTARGRAYWFTVRRGENHDIVGEANPDPSHFASVGYYEDEYVKENGHWLFKKRTIHEMHPAMEAQPLKK